MVFGFGKKKTPEVKEAENTIHVMKEEENALHKDEVAIWKMTDEQYKDLRLKEKIYRDFRKSALKAVHFMEVHIKHGEINSDEYTHFFEKLKKAKNEIEKMRTRMGIEKEIAQKIMYTIPHFLEDLHRLEIPFAKHEMQELQLISPEEEKVIQYTANIIKEIEHMHERCTRLQKFAKTLQGDIHNQANLQAYEKEAQQLLLDDELFYKGLTTMEKIEEDIMNRVEAIKQDDKRLESLFENHIHKYKEAIAKGEYKGGSWEKDQIDTMTAETKKQLGINESEARNGHYQG